MLIKRQVKAWCAGTYITYIIFEGVLLFVEEYFQQFDRRCNMIVGLHWREYTIADTRELIGRMGFDAVQSYFFAERHGGTGAIRAVVRRLAYLYGPFRPFQVVIGRKHDVPVCDFWRTNASD